jgi:ABC-type multidrug transport system fused ATPase/permease subunit
LFYFQCDVRVFTIFDTEPTIPLEGGIVPAFAPCPSSTSLGLHLESDKDFHEGNHPDRSSLSSGHIEFDNVTFRYPMRTEVAVLTDFSLTIAPQQTVALVGPSGSGKICY